MKNLMKNVLKNSEKCNGKCIATGAHHAKFGQREVNIGMITSTVGRSALTPVSHLTHAVGKSRVMELVLTGCIWSLQDVGFAYRWSNTYKFIKHYLRPWRP